MKQVRKIFVPTSLFLFGLIVGHSLASPLHFSSLGQAAEVRQEGAPLRVAASATGKRMKLTVWRDKKEKEIEVAPGEQPQEVARAGGRDGDETSSAVFKGLQVRNLTPALEHRYELVRGLQGVVIDSIEDGSPAEEAGLQPGDVILEINRKPVHNVNDYERIVSGLKREESALLLLHRRGSTLFLTLDAA